MATLRRTGVLHLTASIVLASAAQLVLKLAMVTLGDRAFLDALMVHPLAGPLWLIWLVLGGLCYGGSMLAWLGALARLPVSLAYPTLSLSFVLVFFAARWLPGLEEAVSPQRLAGIVLIVAGNLVVAWPGAPDAPHA